MKKRVRTDFKARGANIAPCAKLPSPPVPPAPEFATNCDALFGLYSTAKGLLPFPADAYERTCWMIVLRTESSVTLAAANNIQSVRDSVGLLASRGIPYEFLAA